MPFTIAALENAGPEHRQAILAHLAEFNRSRAGASGKQIVCIAVEDEAGALAGGLYGTVIYDWLVIELLFVPEALRGSGTGSELIARAEQIAHERGCAGAWLDTFSFQARGFYEKLGYTLVGTIPDHPRGGARYFMMKRFT